MDRRTFILSAGVVFATSVAGCTEDDVGDGTNSGGGDGGDGGDSTPSDGEDDSDGSGGENTSAETEQSVYEIGDTFTVGNDDETVEYTVSSANAYSSLGGEFTSEDASGVFVVVVIDMTNQTDETINASSNHLKLVDDQGREFDADAGASVYAESDSRVEAEGFAFEQLNPGLTTSGAVIFDVSPGTSYELLVEPVGIFSTADSKQVALGEITTS